ncbi:MAG: MerR family transcriptional regulator [Geobacter sp.]|nr:MerR family transcriptional regulator [Geobacter sp.]
MSEETLTPIGELATSLGLTTRTLRYWEEVGIIESAERADGAARGYTPYFVRRIKFIMKLKHLGLTIREMQALYSAYGDAKQTDRMLPALIAVLEDHVEKIDSRIQNLNALRTEIDEYRQRMSDKLANSLQ